jgi:hypothetical protein
VVRFRKGGLYGGGEPVLLHGGGIAALLLILAAQLHAGEGIPGLAGQALP